MLKFLRELLNTRMWRNPVFLVLLLVAMKKLKEYLDARQQVKNADKKQKRNQLKKGTTTHKAGKAVSFVNNNSSSHQKKKKQQQAVAVDGDSVGPFDAPVPAQQDASRPLGFVSGVEGEFTMRQSTENNPLQFPVYQTLLNEAAVVVVHDAINCEKFMTNILALLAESKQDQIAIGFDLEWAPQRKKNVPGEPKRKQSRVSIVQIAVRSVVYVIQVVRIGCITPKLQEVLGNEKILKLGVACMGDATKMWKDWEVKVRGCVELGYVLKLYAHLKEGLLEEMKFGVSLARCIKQVTGVVLIKDFRVRCGNWEREILSLDQVLYAAADAHFALRVLDTLLEWSWAKVPAEEDRVLPNTWCAGFLDCQFKSKITDPNAAAAKALKKACKGTGRSSKTRSFHPNVVINAIMAKEHKAASMAKFATETVLNNNVQCLTDFAVIPGIKVFCDGSAERRIKGKYQKGIKNNPNSYMKPTLQRIEQGGVLYSSHEAYNLLKKSYKLENSWRSTRSVTGHNCHYVIYEFPVPVRVSGYALRATPHPACKGETPLNWNLYGRHSEDEAWTLLDAVRDEARFSYPTEFKHDKVPGEERFYGVTHPADVSDAEEEEEEGKVPLTEKQKARKKMQKKTKSPEEMPAFRYYRWCFIYSPDAATAEKDKKRLQRSITAKPTFIIAISSLRLFGVVDQYELTELTALRTPSEEENKVLKFDDSMYKWCQFEQSDCTDRRAKRFEELDTHHLRDSEEDGPVSKAMQDALRRYFHPVENAFLSKPWAAEADNPYPGDLNIYHSRMIPYHWISVRFPVPVTLTSYEFAARQRYYCSRQSPRDWIVQARNEGDDKWVTLEHTIDDVPWDAFPRARAKQLEQLGGDDFKAQLVNEPLPPPEKREYAITHGAYSSYRFIFLDVLDIESPPSDSDAVSDCAVSTKRGGKKFVLSLTSVGLTGSVSPVVVTEGEETF